MNRRAEGRSQAPTSTPSPERQVSHDSPVSEIDENSQFVIWITILSSLVCPHGYRPSRNDSPEMKGELREDALINFCAKKTPLSRKSPSSFSQLPVC